MQSTSVGAFRKLGQVLLSLATFATLATSAQAAGVLNIGVPSAAAAQSPGHPYRAGLERAVLTKACNYIKTVRCVIKELPTFPGPADEAKLKAAKLDAYLNGTTLIAGSSAAGLGLPDAIQELAETGDLGKLRRQYLDTKRAWGLPVTVGVDKRNEGEVKRLCAAIKAECTLVRNNDAKALAKLFDDKKVDWVVGAHGWLIGDKALEDRINMAQQPDGADHDH